MMQGIRRAGAVAAVGVALALAGTTHPAAAQPTTRTTVETGDSVPEWLRAHIPNPDDPRYQEWAAQQKQRRELERELQRLRATYFRDTRAVERRQVGIAELRKYTEPFAYPSLLEVFKRDGWDVRTAILDMLQDQATDEADATLAWVAVFDHDPALKVNAEERLLKRIAKTGEVSDRIKLVLAGGLQRDRNADAASAAGIIRTLRLHDMIPLLIASQVRGETRGATEARNSSLGWIVIGQQIAFVSDLTPVVADSAVGFDPTLSVVTEGVVLRVIDAVVVTYRVEVHNALVGLTSELWGRSTAGLGWDREAWMRWYNSDFLPHMRAREGG
ncbi:MAG: hypothetical protein KIS87_09345 [Phycisphaeraceae bacterium]|nr:hypothetical protein [Phycisphaeraceae bacterium]